MARKAAGVSLDGLADLRDTFRNVAPKEADKAAEDTVGAVAEAVEKTLFRKLQNYANTGRLMHSLFTRRKKVRDGIATAEVRGGATAPYLLMAEFGTSKTKAQPAIVPTVEELRPQMPQMYRELFAEKLAKRMKRKR